MLSLGPDSCCDVCFEKFGPNTKAPWSIECGHVFCASCIGNIESLCPMCRVPFNHDTCIKLHVDLDDMAGPVVPQDGPSEEVQEARRIWKAIADIPLGATENTMRNLVHDGEAFFKQQQDSTPFKDLKAVFQITSHLYEVKRKYRAQSQKSEKLAKQIKDIEDDNEQLMAEKKELERQLEKLEETRQYEAETAAAVEASLQGHIDLAMKEKDVADQKLKKTEKENATLRMHLERKWRKSTGDKLRDEKDNSVSFNAPTVFDTLDPEGTAIHDPTSLIISPFAGFGSSILPMVDAIAAEPPESEEDSGESQDSTDNEDEEISTTAAAKHSIQARGHQEVKSRSSADDLLRTRTGHSQEPSGLSRTAPYRDHNRRERSQSNPSQTNSRSQSPFSSIVGSTSPTPPIQTTAAPHGASSREMQSFAHGGGTHVLRSRLQELLSDKPLTSTSLPAVSSTHFLSSLAGRDATLREERGSSLPKSIPSRTPGTSISQQHFTSSNAPTSHQPSHSPINIKIPPSTSPTTSTAPRMSSASAEAKKLEEERRRKYSQESMQHGQGQDRAYTDADRDGRHFTPPSNSYVSNASSSASQAAAARRDHHQQSGVYLSTNVNPMPPLSRRGSSATSVPTHNGPGSYGRPEPGLPSPQEQGPPIPVRYTSASSSLKSAVSRNIVPPNPSSIYA